MTFSLGGSLGPLIIRPFLVNFDTGTTNTTSLPAHSNVSDDEEPDLGLVRYSYVTIGCLALLPGIAFFVLFLLGGPSLKSPTHTGTATGHGRKDVATWFTVTMLFFLFLNFHCTVYIEGCTMNYIASFVVRYLDWENRQGALMVSVFHGSLAFGRLCSIGVAAIFSPRTMLIFNLITTACAYGLMCFVGYGDSIMWVSAAMAGVFQSSTFPTSLLWASRYIRVTGRATSVFILGASSASLVYPQIVAYFFESENEMYMVYMLLGVALYQILNYIIMQMFAHFKHDSAKCTNKVGVERKWGEVMKIEVQLENK